jgi:hypothetical protein
MGPTEAKGRKLTRATRATFAIRADRIRTVRGRFRLGRTLSFTSLLWRTNRLDWGAAGGGKDGGTIAPERPAFMVDAGATCAQGFDLGVAIAGPPRRGAQVAPRSSSGGSDKLRSR